MRGHIIDHHDDGEPIYQYGHVKLSPLLKRDILKKIACEQKLDFKGKRDLIETLSSIVDVIILDQKRPKSVDHKKIQQHIKKLLKYTKQLTELREENKVIHERAKYYLSVAVDKFPRVEETGTGFTSSVTDTYVPPGYDVVDQVEAWFKNAVPVAKALKLAAKLPEIQGLNRLFMTMYERTVTKERAMGIILFELWVRLTNPKDKKLSYETEAYGENAGKVKDTSGPRFIADCMEACGLPRPSPDNVVTTYKNAQKKQKSTDV